MLRCIWRRLHPPKRPFVTSLVSFHEGGQGLGDPQVLWQNAFSADAPQAMRHRDSLYKSVNQELPVWALTILEGLPTNKRTVDDYRFALRILIRRELREEARNMLLSVARRHPLYWESLLNEIVPEEPVYWLLSVFAESLVAQGMTYTLSHPGPPTDRILQRIVKRAFSLVEGPSSLSHILDSMSNTVISSRLGTAVLRACYASHLNPENTGIFDWKIQKHTATPDDLKYVLLALLRTGQPSHALRLFDIHKRSLNIRGSGVDEVGLAAAASAHQWDRLEVMFNEMTAFPNKYKTVLSALASLGGTQALEEIWHQLVNVDKIMPTYGICHAMMFSMRRLGETARVHHYFCELMKYMAPLRSSFRILLGAYRDASDLQSALDLMSEMSGTHQLPLTAAEFSVLLSLCAKTRDLESSRTVWSWANSALVEIDRPLKNSYLKCLVEANCQEEALQFWSEEFTTNHQEIDTLTVMLGLAARRGNTQLFNVVRNIAEEQGTKLDGTWFVEVIRFYARVGDYQNASGQLLEMRRRHIEPNGDHYSLIGGLQTKYRLVDESADTYERAKESGALSFGFMGQQLRLLARNKDVKVRRIGERVALDLLKRGGNDPASDVLARSKVPVSTVKATIRTSLRPGGDPKMARRILDKLHDNPTSTQPWMVWGQELIYYSSLQKWKKFQSAWVNFFESVKQNATVLQVDKSYKLPPRYRLVFEQQITARIRHLATEQNDGALKNLPEELNSIGINFTRRNWNLWVCALAETGNVVEAFRIVQQEGTFGKGRSDDSKPIGVRPMTRAVLIKSWPKLLKCMTPEASYRDAAEHAVQTYGYLARYVRERYENPAKSKKSV